MKTDSLKQGILMENSAGVGTVTRGMVRERAVDLAAINGHLAQNVSPAEWAQAKRELTGEPDAEPRQEILEAAPESQRWDPLPGSIGHQAAATSNEDEDGDGRSDSERLVEAGIAEAEHDQMLQAARAAAQEDAQ